MGEKEEKKKDKEREKGKSQLKKRGGYVKNGPWGKEMEKKKGELERKREMRFR